MDPVCWDLLFSLPLIYFFNSWGLWTPHQDSCCLFQCCQLIGQEFQPSPPSRSQSDPPINDQYSSSSRSPQPVELRGSSELIFTELNVSDRYGSGQKYTAPPPWPGLWLTGSMWHIAGGESDSPAADSLKKPSASWRSTLMLSAAILNLRLIAAQSAARGRTTKIQKTSTETQNSGPSSLNTRILTRSDPAGWHHEDTRWSLLTCFHKSASDWWDGAPGTRTSLLIQKRVSRKIQDENSRASKYPHKTKLHRNGPCSFAFPPAIPPPEARLGMLQLLRRAQTVL